MVGLRGRSGIVSLVRPVLLQTCHPSTSRRPIRSPAPIGIEDIAEGERILVEILDLATDALGFTFLRPGSGILGDQVHRPFLSSMGVERRDRSLQGYSRSASAVSSNARCARRGSINE